MARTRSDADVWICGSNVRACTPTCRLQHRRAIKSIWSLIILEETAALAGLPVMLRREWPLLHHPAILKKGAGLGRGGGGEEQVADEQGSQTESAVSLLQSFAN
jgi:hypothetical protein